MFKSKMFAGILLIAAILFAQVGTALAAPQAQDTTPITGTITNIVLETDELGVTTVLVTLVDDMEVEQTVRLSVDTAEALGLVILDPDTMEPIVDESQVVGMSVEVDPSTVIPDEEPAEEPTDESYSPISILLAAFFGEDAGVIDGYHDDGFGFGVIAQSLWMSQNVGGDASLAGEIMIAKTTGDYSAFFPEDAEDVPANWGQFKKALSDKKNNLGSIVSGHAENNDVEEQSLDQTQQPGNGHGNSNNNGNGNNGKGNNKDKGNNGKGNGKNK